MSFSNSCDKRFHQSPPTHKSDITACHYAMLYRVDIWYAYYVIQYFLQTQHDILTYTNSTLVLCFLLSPHMEWEQKGQRAARLTCSGRDDRHRACYGNKVKRYIWLFGELTFHTSALPPSTVQERREARTMFKMISVSRILFFIEQNISALQFSWELLPAITNHPLCELVLSLFFWVHLV